MISQPLAVRDEQTGQPAAGNLLDPEVVMDQGVSGPVRCAAGLPGALSLYTASGIFRACPKLFDVQKIEVSQRKPGSDFGRVATSGMKQGR